MSTERRVRRCCTTVTASASASAPELARGPLPIDLLLEIVARSDLTTVVRCAATSRIDRRAILDPAFRHRLALRSAADGGGFDPALLLGFSFLRCTKYSVVPARRVIHTPPPSKHRVRLDTGSSLWKPFESLAARDGLLLLRRCKDSSTDPESPGLFGLHVCNTVTGRVTHLPPASVRDDYHAFLSVGDGDAGSSYELLVADKEMQFQTFSSKNFFDGQWGAVREASLPELRPPRLRASSRPAVAIGRTVYWLCPASFWEWQGSHGIFAVALDVDAADETIIELPPGCFSRMTLHKKDKHLLLASVRGLLSLLVVEAGGLSMWTLTPASSPDYTATWSRQLLVGRAEIEKTVGLVSSSMPFVLEGFGERSGAVILRVDRNHLLRLDLGTNVVTEIPNRTDGSITCVFLHETDLTSLLQAMKSF